MLQIYHMPRQHNCHASAKWYIIASPMYNILDKYNAVDATCQNDNFQCRAKFEEAEFRGDICEILYHNNLKAYT